MNHKVLIIVNPVSGKKNIKNIYQELKKILKKLILKQK